jgi:hypothetical protein
MLLQVVKVFRTVNLPVLLSEQHNCVSDRLVEGELSDDRDCPVGDSLLLGLLDLLDAECVKD